MSKRIALLSAVALSAFALTATVVAPVSAQEKTVMVGGAAMFPSKNSIQNAVNSKDHTTLVAAVKAAGLVQTLEGKGPFTVFAPTNAAFGKLPDGKRLVSEKNLLERRKTNVPVGEDAFYGMGLETDKTWGVTVVHHGGSMDGYKSDWIAIPDAGVGAVLLTNADMTESRKRRVMSRPRRRGRRARSHRRAS